MNQSKVPRHRAQLQPAYLAPGHSRLGHSVYQNDEVLKTLGSSSANGKQIDAMSDNCARVHDIPRNRDSRPPLRRGECEGLGMGSVMVTNRRTRRNKTRSQPPYSARCG